MPVSYLLRSALVLLLFAVATTAAPVRAHEGHDHGPPAPTQAAMPQRPLLETTGTDVELVARLLDGVLILHIDRFATNAPVTDATVEVTINGGAPVIAGPQADGTYRLAADWAGAGSHELVVTVTGPDVADLLVGVLEVPDGADLPHAAEGGALPLSGLVIAFALGVAVAAVGAALLGRRRATGLAVLPLAAVLLLPGGRAMAHEGHDHGAPETAAVSGDSPRRLPDGSLFVPKRTQHLLEVRTSQVAPTAARRGHTLVGRVIPDPNAAGRVQASQVGRVEAPEAGLPYIGQRVSAGDVLAYVVPALDTAARGGIQEQLAGIEKDIVVARQQLNRISNLAGTVPQREIDDARAILTGLERQRDALSPTLAMREALRSPIDGVVAVANAIPGQMIDDRDETVLFEVVDPTKLLVEAIAFDPAAARAVSGAAAVTDEGATLRLDLLGASPARRDQAIPLLFRVEASDGMTAGPGTPVRVHLRNAEAVTGIVLPREAVVRGRDGLPIVWDKVAPQRFEARPVVTQPLDGETVLVLSGVQAGQRIVTRGAGLLNQVR